MPKQIRDEFERTDAPIPENVPDIDPENVSVDPNAPMDIPKAPPESPNDFVCLHMGVGQWRKGDIIPVGALSVDQMRRLLDIGAIAPKSAMPPQVTIAHTTNTDYITLE